MDVKTVRTDYGTYTIHRDAPHPDHPYLIFLAGGPGISAKAEQAFITPYLREQVNLLWFDQLGNAGAPAHSPELITWRNAARDIAHLVRVEIGAPVHVLAHCAGLLTLNSILHIDRSVVHSATIIAPEGSVVAFKGIVRGVIATGRLKLEGLDSTLRGRLDRFLGSSESEWGRAEVELVLDLYAQTDDWFGFYWRDPEARARFEALGPEAPIAVEAFTRLAIEHFERKGSPSPDYAGIPTHVIWGGDDPCIVREEQEPYVKRMIPNARMTEIPDGFHWPHFERPEATLKAILDFIRGATEPPTAKALQETGRASL